MRDETASAESGSTDGDLEAALASNPEPSRDVDTAVVVASSAVIEDAEVTLAGVEAALDRLESGEYGTCEVCHAVIEPQILARTPVARRCSVHST